MNLNEFLNVGTIEYNNITLYSASELCKMVGIKNVSLAVKSIDSEQVLKVMAQGKGSINRKYPTLYLTEAGVFEVVIRSNKEKAKELKRFLFKEVLPSLNSISEFTIDRKALKE